jgi:glycosyltransferase involved in cell wall biosynthesis
MEMKRVFFAGHLRPFKHVGRHPQFQHIHNPPAGYEFVTSGEASSAKYRTIKSLSRLCRDALANGSTVKDLSRFIRSRSLRAQISFPNSALAFLPSTPFILGQAPWVIEIEDTTTLFAPFPRINGKRVYPRLLGRDGIYDSGFFPSVKALLENESCRGIICHVRSTAQSIPILFGNRKLAEKVSHIPMGTQVPPYRKKRTDTDAVTLLFTNSWHQGATGFYLRGGLDLLEAYSMLHSENKNLRLIVRSKLPDDLDGRYHEIIERCNVVVIDRFLSEDEFRSLFDGADIYVLPSARLHVVSLLQAMAHGLAVVASDGWGISEYVDHERNGLIVPGRYGEVSWMDANGMLMEDYRPLLSGTPNVANALKETLALLIKKPGMRWQLGETAKRDVETKFSLTSWNLGLRRAFDRALGLSRASGEYE